MHRCSWNQCPLLEPFWDRRALLRETESNCPSEKCCRVTFVQDLSKLCSTCVSSPLKEFKFLWSTWWNIVSPKRFKTKCIFSIREHIIRCLHISFYSIRTEIWHKYWNLLGGLLGRCSICYLLQKVAQRNNFCFLEGASFCSACQS